MASFTQHQQGTFCWPELASHDWAKTKTFFTQLFGWGFNDMPLGNDCFYTMLQKDGDDIGATYQMGAEQMEQGIPTNWLQYIAVDNVDEMGEKAQSLGAEVVMGPCDVPGAGRMVMLQDPNGAPFALWQGAEHIGSKRLGETGTMCWNEMATTNVEKAKGFYCELFGWSTKISPMDGFDYVEFMIGDTSVGGLIEINESWGEGWEEFPSHWMLYFAVEDTDESCKKSEELGGSVCVPPTDIPDVGRFAVINDPTGGTFSVIKMENPQ